MTATPGGAETLPLMTVPLGRTATAPLTVTNPLGVETEFSASVARAGAAGGGAGCRFKVAPGAFALAPYASKDLEVRHSGAHGCGPERASAGARAPTDCYPRAWQRMLSCLAPTRPPSGATWCVRPLLGHSQPPLQVSYSPGSLGCEERASITVAGGAAAGGVTYALSGRGLMPGEGGDEDPAVVTATLGEGVTKVKAQALPRAVHGAGRLWL